MNKNLSRKDQKSLEESLKGGYNYPRQKGQLSEDAIKLWSDLIKKDPIFVIDLDTLKLRPPKYK